MTPAGADMGDRNGASDGVPLEWGMVLFTDVCIHTVRLATHLAPNTRRQLAAYIQRLLWPHVEGLASHPMDWGRLLEQAERNPDWLMDRYPFLTRFGPQVLDGPPPETSLQILSGPVLATTLAWSKSRLLAQGPGDREANEWMAKACECAWRAESVLDHFDGLFSELGGGDGPARRPGHDPKETYQAAIMHYLLACRLPDDGRLTPVQFNSLERLAGLLRQGGRATEAILVLGAIVIVYPKAGYSLLHLADLLKERGILPQAIVYYLQALSVVQWPPTRMAIHARLADALRYAGEPEEAVDHYLSSVNAGQTNET